jgi:hypothetical protein
MRITNHFVRLDIRLAAIRSVVRYVMVLKSLVTLMIAVHFFFGIPSCESLTAVVCLMENLVLLGVSANRSRADLSNSVHARIRPI